MTGMTRMTRRSIYVIIRSFEMYSCVDERSAAYMAVGMAAESGEPVVLTCTGATASRNYMSGLTDAYYRRLPIIAVTSTRPLSTIGNHVAQVIDRTTLPNDMEKPLPEGALQGLFSVAEERQVLFSKGNLQYQQGHQSRRLYKNRSIWNWF